jgi:hypothetical protein
MLTRVEQINSLDELFDYVNETLCEHCQLQIDAFPLTQCFLRRAGKPCGIYYCLHGPRAVKFIAIWETDRNSILFYGSNGERFQKTQLLEAPSLECFETCHLEEAAA